MIKKRILDDLLTSRVLHRSIGINEIIATSASKDFRPCIFTQILKQIRDIEIIICKIIICKINILTS
jgi:hypothetical protein